MPSANKTTKTQRAAPSSRPPHQRHRSASDPFLDPVYPAPSLPYRSDALPRSAAATAATSAPSVPAKQAARKIRPPNDVRDPRMLEAAVREAVTVRPVDSPRARVGRSQTGGVQTSASSSRPSPGASRRSYSQDSVTQAANVADKARRSAKSGAKKGSAHADVIDRLDFTGVGPMFHHDGPFDACAPSRNRHKSKAPMLAWTSPDDEAPASAAHLRADRRTAAGLDPYSMGMGAANSDSPYPNVAFPADDYAVKNPKQVDRIAEAWGIHEPEPYEEFFGGAAPRGIGDTSGASSARGSMDGYGAAQNARLRTRDGREHYHDRHDEARPQARKNGRHNLPPPQPLNLPGTTASRPVAAAANDYSVPSGSPPSPGFAATGQPKRSKSLMQKFRKMRDMPNVPLGAQQDDGAEEPSPPSSLENYSDNARTGRPAHRHNNSFFGKKIGRNTSAQGGPVTPTRDVSTANPNEQFVYVERAQQQKALPPRPQETPASPGYDKEDYFNAPPGSPGSPTTPGTNMGRKASLLRKMKGVLGATNK